VVKPRDCGDETLTLAFDKIFSERPSGGIKIRLRGSSLHSTIIYKSCGCHRTGAGAVPDLSTNCASLRNRNNRPQDDGLGKHLVLVKE
jgi:hypothetical protein